LVVFGTASALLPFVFAAVTIPPALGIAWGVAHVLSLSDYLRNMVLMIGLGIAIDYSLLVVNRYRDERRRGLDHLDAVDEAMLHTGRTIVFSGIAVSLGLVLMLVLPVPFLQGFGVGGLLIPRRQHALRPDVAAGLARGLRREARARAVPSKRTGGAPASG
jgi:RND superfamily putative drug exporter